MTTRTLSRFLGAAVIALLAACSSTAPSSTTTTTTTEAATPTTIRIASLKGPTTMGLVKLMSDAEAGETRHDYQVTMYGTPDEIVPLVAQGQVDVAMVPSNLASVLYNRTEGAVQVAAINTLGVLYLVENGETVSSVEDLRGRTIYATGKGSSPEYVLDHILRGNGIDPATDVTVEWKSEHTELAVLLAEGADVVALLPQPFVTIVQQQNPNARVALDLTEEWAAVTPDSSLVMGVAIVSRDFAAENPAAFTEFLADYEESTAFTNENPAEAAALIAEYGIVPAAPIAEKAIPASNIVFIAGSELRQQLEGYLQVLFEANPQSIGGALPGDDFWYEG